MLPRSPQRRAESHLASPSSSTRCQLWHLLLIYSALEKHLTEGRHDAAAAGDRFCLLPLGQKLSQAIRYRPGSR